ncbi:hypothetical protein HN911_00250 [Candidatus Bathyarchaeota archaeon]|nr:hypothetical protein [Candidatus Bathyarchaeota archaeon]
MVEEESSIAAMQMSTKTYEEEEEMAVPIRDIFLKRSARSTLIGSSHSLSMLSLPIRANALVLSSMESLFPK